MTPKEVAIEAARGPFAAFDSLVIYPLQQYVVSKVVEGLQWLDDAQDVFPED